MRAKVRQQTRKKDKVQRFGKVESAGLDLMGEGRVQNGEGWEEVEDDYNFTFEMIKTGRFRWASEEKTTVCLVWGWLNSVDIPGQKLKSRWK